MTKSFLLLGTLVALAVAGCGGNGKAADANVLIDNNFDTMAGWIPEPQSATLSHDKAHSGRYALKVDPGHDFSASYKLPLGQLHETRVKKMRVSAWGLAAAADAKASLVVVVANPGNDKPLLWEALELPAKTPGQWTEASKVITVPENAMPSSVLGIYLWRTGGSQPFYLDDLRVTIEE